MGPRNDKAGLLQHALFHENARCFYVFTNKAPDGRNNLCGENVARFRKSLGLSQRELADRLQLLALDIDKNAVQRIECGKRFVTDIELAAFARFFRVPPETLLK